MEPEWHQDINTKGIQPKHLPHFETAGQQMDWEQRKLAAKLIVSRWGGILLGVCLLVGILFAPQAFKQRKTWLSQKPETDRPEKFRGQIMLSVHSIKRESSVPGQLFLTSRARSGFKFLIIEVTVSNQSQDRFALNPLSFGVFTGDGTQYKTSLNTLNHPDGLRSKKIKIGKESRGLIIFQIPKQARLNSLELLGSRGVIARAPL